MRSDSGLRENRIKCCIFLDKNSTALQVVTTVPKFKEILRVGHLLADLGLVNSDLLSSQAGGLLLWLPTAQA